jgi:hypothetical protein
METTCYCIYCPKHPLHKEQNNLGVLTGWMVGDWIMDDKYKKQGRKVNCLAPSSNAFESGYLDIGSASEHEFPVTAYDDGYAATGFILEGSGYHLKVFAYCGNEKYEEVEGE